MWGSFNRKCLNNGKNLHVVSPHGLERGEAVADHFNTRMIPHHFSHPRQEVSVTEQSYILIAGKTGRQKNSNIKSMHKFL